MPENLISSDIKINRRNLLIAGALMATSPILASCNESWSRDHREPLLRETGTQLHLLWERKLYELFGGVFEDDQYVYVSERTGNSAFDRWVWTKLDRYTGIPVYEYLDGSRVTDMHAQYLHPNNGEILALDTNKLTGLHWRLELPSGSSREKNSRLGNLDDLAVDQGFDTYTASDFKSGKKVWQRKYNGHTVLYGNENSLYSSETTTGQPLWPGRTWWIGSEISRINPKSGETLWQISLKGSEHTEGFKKETEEHFNRRTWNYDFFWGDDQHLLLINGNNIYILNANSGTILRRGSFEPHTFYVSIAVSYPKALADRQNIYFGLGRRFIAYNRANNALDIKEFPEDTSSRIDMLAKSKDLLFLETSHFTTRKEGVDAHSERIYETRWSNLYCYQVN